MLDVSLTIQLDQTVLLIFINNCLISARPTLLNNQNNLEQFLSKVVPKVTEVILNIVILHNFQDVFVADTCLKALKSEEYAGNFKYRS